MHIQCTKKLLDFLKPNITETDATDNMYAWHANYININRKKLLVICNDLTRFTIVFYGVKKKDFEKIHLWFITGLFNAMNYCGFSTRDIMKYLENSPSEITFNRSGTRKGIARLNKSVEAADWAAYDDGVYIDVLEQNHIAYSVNRYIIWEEKETKNIYHPADKLKELIDLL